MVRLSSSLLGQGRGDLLLGTANRSRPSRLSSWVSELAMVAVHSTHKHTQRQDTPHTHDVTTTTMVGSWQAGRGEPTDLPNPSFGWLSLDGDRLYLSPSLSLGRAADAELGGAVPAVKLEEGRNGVKVVNASVRLQSRRAVGERERERERGRELWRDRSRQPMGELA